MPTENKNDLEIQQRTKNINTTIALCALSIFIILWILLVLHMQPHPEVIDMAILQKCFQQEDNKQDFKRLHKYHGYPAVVILEEGKVPYFYDKQGKKATFAYPEERTPREKNGKYYASLTTKSLCP